MPDVYVLVSEDTKNALRNIKDKNCEECDAQDVHADLDLGIEDQTEREINYGVRTGVEAQVIRVQKGENYKGSHS